MKPEVEAIEQVCAELARLTAHSSNIVWRYYQLIASVLAAMPQGGQSSCLADRHLSSHLRFTTPEDITRLMMDPSFQLGEPLERDNRDSIAAICQTKLTELHARLSEALRCLNETRRALHGLKMIGLTARYLAFCIASEAAAPGEAGMNYGSRGRDRSCGGRTGRQNACHEELDRQWSELGGVAAERE